MTRRYVATCDECGWTSRPAKTEGLALFGLRLHDCDKHRRLTARAAKHAQWMAAVDRTPKPCRHKQATHTHGTYACYVLDGCRCPPCAAARSEAERNRKRLHAYGRFTHLVDAQPVRDHVHHLAEHGIGLKRLVVLSGVSHGTLWKLMYGKTRPDGTRRLTVRVHQSTAQRLLAIQPRLELLGATVPVDGTGARRRLQALVTQGWSITRLGQQLHLHNIHRTIHHRGNVNASTARNVRDLYDRLWNTPPPQTNRGERIAASRSRHYAQRQGWLPPLAWDDETIDDPAAIPFLAILHPDCSPWDDPLDRELLIQRMLTGQHVDIPRADLVTAIAALAERGLSDTQIAQLVRRHPDHVQRVRRQHRIPSQRNAETA